MATVTFRGVFFIGLFAICSAWALAEPFAGVVAYTVHYHSYPERSWWGGGLTNLGIRYSYTITICLTLGTLLNLSRLPYGRLVTRQEALYLAFLGWILVLGSITGMKSATFRGGSTGVVDAVDKMVKMAVFVLALTHVVVTPRRFTQYTWLLVSCAIYLGFEAATAPAGAYFKGRLEKIGGPDFADANALGAHVLALMPILGVRFLKGDLKEKGVSLAASGLAANAVVATRSRSAFVAAIMGFVLALIIAPKGERKRFAPLLIVAALGSFFVVDAGFIERMGTLGAEKRQADESALARQKVWAGTMQMIRDYPIGVGPSNFPAYIGNYVPEEAGRDTHQTFLRCAAELGVPGFGIFVGLILNAFWTLRQLRKTTADFSPTGEEAWFAFALQISLFMYLLCGLFGSFIYSEMLWWLLLLPSALERVVVNARKTASDLFLAPGLMPS